MTVINLLVVVVFLILYAVYQLAPRSFAGVTTVRNAAPARRIESWRFPMYSPPWSENGAR